MTPAAPSQPLDGRARGTLIPDWNHFQKIAVCGASTAVLEEDP